MPRYHRDHILAPFSSILHLMTSRPRLHESGSIWNRSKMSSVRPSVYMGPATIPNGTASLPKRDRLEKSSIRNRTNISTVGPSVYMGPATVANGTASLPKTGSLRKKFHLEPY